MYQHSFSNSLSFYKNILNELEKNFHILLKSIDQPIYTKFADINVFRYESKTIEIAMVQLMARIISGLNASIVLIEKGFMQECNVLYRTLDDFENDITFLSKALIDNDITGLHKRYLDNFFAEEFDGDAGAFNSVQKRDIIPRDKIRAFISRMAENPVNQSDAQKNFETIDKAYSGYVHGTSVHIIDMYGGYPTKYHVNGLPSESPSVVTVKNQFIEYLHRGIFSLSMISFSLKEDDVFENLKGLNSFFEEKMDRTEWRDPNILLNKIKNSRAGFEK